ncbi:MAG: hypothetical protein LBU70_01010 [Chitinispirillales bacterium]|nr:hypothetical protein [Chitinispirillales bacterium]
MTVSWALAMTTFETVPTGCPRVTIHSIVWLHLSEALENSIESHNGR